MKQTITTLTILIIIVGLFSIIVSGSKKRLTKPEIHGSSETNQASENARETDTDIFYWGTTCPHCHDVIEWMEENKIDEKLRLVRKEVYQNRQNSLELTQRAQSCGLNANRIGVPFMYTTEGECLMGTPDITSYLAAKVNQTQDTNEATSSAETKK